MILTERFIILLAIGALLIGISVIFAPLMTLGIALISLTIVITIADWLRTPQRSQFEITRLCDDKLSLGAENLIKIHVRNASYARIQGKLRDEYPEGFDAQDNMFTLNLAPRSEDEYSYHVKPPCRGDYKFADIYIRLYGPLGLIARQIRYDMSKHVKVYPNLLDMRRYEIGLKRERAIQPGQRVTRAYGKGTDFESLREYGPDDEFRSVDWKATARRGKLMTRQYQQERSQNIMIVLDCGRTMGPIISGLTKLDHGINAAMMLAHVAALKGDKVGLLAFSEDIISYSAPKAGRHQTLSLLSQTYNLKDAQGDSNYYKAMPYLAKKWTRRSLIVVFTDLVDPESSKPLISQIASLTKKHLCLCVTLSDPAVIEAAHKKPSESEDPFIMTSARQSLHARKLAAAQLARAGAIVLDIPPEKFTPTVVNQYLEVKSRAQL